MATQGPAMEPGSPEPSSGKLEEHPLSEVLLRLEAGGHDGTLRLARGGTRARIELVAGLPVAVHAPGVKRLGDLLIASGLCDPITVRQAARVQAEEQGRRPLGEILISHGVLGRDDLEHLIAQQVAQALADLKGWKNGRFSFEPQAPPLPPMRDSATRVAATAATRRDSSRQRASRPAGTRATAPAPKPSPPAAVAAGPLAAGPPAILEPPAASAAPAPLTLMVHTHDDDLLETLALALPVELATVVRAPGPSAALPGARGAAGRDTWLLADLRSAPRISTAMRTVLDLQAPMPVIVVLDPGANAAPAYGAGALAVVPADAEVIAAAVANLAALLPGRDGPRPTREPAPQPAPAGSGLVAELDPLTGSATVALDLMQAISPFVERAVLFLLSRRNLTVAGAFGDGADGRLLVSLTRGLKLELAGESSLAASIASNRPVSLDFEAAHLPRKLAKLLGPPVTGQSLLLPVSGGGSVVALIYADNGSVERWISDLAPLEAAVARFGPSFETELLIGEAARTLG